MNPPFRMLLAGLVALATLPKAVWAWTTPTPVLDTGQDSLDPRLAVDTNGRAHVIWRERTGGSTFRIWYTSNTAGPFAAAMEISHATSQHSYAPVLAVDGTTVHVAWNCDLTGINFEVWYRKLTTGSWGEIYNASNTAIKSLRPAIAARGGVGPVVAWDEALYADDNYDTYFSEWSGSGFTPSMNISNTPGGAVYGSVNVNLVVAPSGDVTAAWADRISGDYHVNARRRVAGLWQSRQELSSLQTGPAMPGMAVGSDNRVHVVYEAEGLIRYQVFDGSAWSSPIALPGGLNSVIRPRIAIDAQGYKHVVADAFTDAQNHRDIFYSTDSGGSWSAWVNISNTWATQSLNADIGYAGGLLTVTWQENSDGAGGTGVYNIWHTMHPLPPAGPTGTISGTVRDNIGHNVPNARVQAAGYYQIAFSGPQGQYSITNVPTGTYSVTAAKAFHESQTIENVLVSAGQTTSVDFQLLAWPPEPVVAFGATPGNTANRLEWTNPTSGNYFGTRIRFSTDHFPTGPTDGTLLADRPGLPGGSDSLEHTGLTNGRTYYYAAFTYTETQVFSSGVNTTGAPFGPADYDHDGDVDQEDFGAFQLCLSGAYTPFPSGCEWANLDGDVDVDEGDCALFVGCMSGADVPASPHCAG